jgi:hypothetical protein
MEDEGDKPLPSVHAYHVPCVCFDHQKAVDNISACEVLIFARYATALECSIDVAILFE